MPTIITNNQQPAELNSFHMGSLAGQFDPFTTVKNDVIAPLLNHGVSGLPVLALHDAGVDSRLLRPLHRICVLVHAGMHIGHDCIDDGVCKLGVTHMAVYDSVEQGRVLPHQPFRPVQAQAQRQHLYVYRREPERIHRTGAEGQSQLHLRKERGRQSRTAFSCRRH